MRSVSIMDAYASGPDRTPRVTAEPLTDDEAALELTDIDHAEPPELALKLGYEWVPFSPAKSTRHRGSAADPRGPTVRS